PAPGQRDGQQGEYAQAEQERDQGRGRALFGQGEAASPREGVCRECRRGDDGAGGDGEPQHPADEAGQGAPAGGREREGERGDAGGQGGGDGGMAGGGRGGEEGGGPGEGEEGRAPRLCGGQGGEKVGGGAVPP